MKTESQMIEELEGNGVSTLDGPTLDSDVPAEVTEAFNDLFSDATPSKEDTTTKEVTPKTTPRGKPTREEELEELEGLETSLEDDPLQDLKKEDEPATDDHDDKSQSEEDLVTEGDDDAPTLSPLLMQAAMRNGWPKEDAEEFFQADPERAVKTFDRLLENYNNLSAEYGKLGMGGAMPPVAPNHGMLPGMPPQPQPLAQPPQPPAPTQSVAREVLQEVFGKEGLEELKDKYDEDFVNDALKPMAKKFADKLDEVVAPLQQQVDQYEADQVRQQCFGFLDNLDPAFNEFYGEGQDINKLEMGQQTARAELFQEADHIRAGMQLHGLQPSLTECLERAHLRVAHKHTSTIERKKITQSVKKRSQGITHRPSQRKKLGKTRTAESAEAAAAKVFNDAATEMGWEN